MELTVEQETGDAVTRGEAGPAYVRVLPRTWKIAVVVVSASPDVQLRRLMARDGMREEDARRFIATQMPLEEKKKVATYVIENDGTQEALASEVDRMLETLAR